MLLDEAEGVISLAEQHLANSLASSARFQGWVGANDSTEALRRIYFTALPEPENLGTYTADELKVIFPSAIIYTGEVSGSTVRKVGFMAAQGAGLVAFRLEEVVPDDTGKGPAVVERAFKNLVGIIMAEIIANAETADCLSATEVVNTELYRVDKDQRVVLDTQLAVVLAAWGTPR